MSRVLPVRRLAPAVHALAVRSLCLAPGVERGPAEVVWSRAGRLLAIRRPSGRIHDLCLLPGLVNAHAHLQLPPLVAGPRQFLPWVGAVLAARAAATLQDHRRVARQNMQRLLADGVTAVGEIDSTGASPLVLERLGIGGRCYQELTGFHLDAAGARQLLQQRQPTARTAVHGGWSPHAPYSVSPALFRAAARSSRYLAIHCAEVPEEQQFLRDGSGPFADLLRQLGRLPASFRPPRTGAVRWLQQLGLLRPNSLLVHCQELLRGDAGRIAAAGAKIVVCPGTMAWFGRPAPPVPDWLARGIPVALGTDSAASNEDFSLRAELRRAARLWPDLAPEQLLAMVTTQAAQAIGCRGLGQLRRGGRADFLLLPARGDRCAAALPAFVHGELAPRWVVAGGRLCSGVAALRG